MLPPHTMSHTMRNFTTTLITADEACKLFSSSIEMLYKHRHVIDFIKTTIRGKPEMTQDITRRANSRLLNENSFVLSYLFLLICAIKESTFTTDAQKERCAILRDITFNLMSSDYQNALERISTPDALTTVRNGTFQCTNTAEMYVIRLYTYVHIDTRAHGLRRHLTEWYIGSNMTVNEATDKLVEYAKAIFHNHQHVYLYSMYYAMAIVRFTACNDVKKKCKQMMHACFKHVNNDYRKAHAAWVLRICAGRRRRQTRGSAQQRAAVEVYAKKQTQRQRVRSPLTVLTGSAQKRSPDKRKRIAVPEHNLPPKKRASRCM